jgi:hypothetical protein
MVRLRFDYATGMRDAGKATCAGDSSDADIVHGRLHYDP